MSIESEISVIVYVNGGVVQGARASKEGIAIEVFDIDNKKAEGMTSNQIEDEEKETYKDYPVPIY